MSSVSRLSIYLSQDLFCSVYILDRTLVFVTNFPQNIKDEDIDEKCLDLVSRPIPMRLLRTS